MTPIYLDYAAATPAATSVLKALRPFYSHQFGNASSLHQFGQAAKAALEQSRKTCARVLNCSVAEIYFTSGGTESINQAISGTAQALKRGHIITSAIEHAAVLETIKALTKQGFSSTIVPVGRDGLVKAGDLAQRFL